MPETEMAGWRTYYTLYPFDDLHRHHRPAAIIAASMGGKFEQVLTALAPTPTDPELSEADRDMVRALGFDR